MLCSIFGGASLCKVDLPKTTGFPSWENLNFTKGAGILTPFLGAQAPPNTFASPLIFTHSSSQTPAIASNFQLDGVVTLCDAKNILRQLASYDTNKSDEVVDEAFQQITYADRIIISKLDLVAPALPCTH